MRGNPQIDNAAAVISNLADYGLVWVALAALKARRRGPNRRRAVFALATAGFSSLIVSRIVKAAVARERPEDHLTATVRTPTSSSFPSGHTLAAFCTAFVLADSDLQTATNVGFATAVAASRVHLRAHHPTDVIGGAAIGSVVGLGLRPIVNAVTPGTKRTPTGPAQEGPGNGPHRSRVEEVVKPFAVTWDYRCPFARNAHEHLIDALADGADWDVTFLPFSLTQTHVPEGGVPVWDDPAKATRPDRPGRRCGRAGPVPRTVPATSTAPCSPRAMTAVWTCATSRVVADVLDRAGVSGDKVLAEVHAGAPIDEIRKAHEQAVNEWDVFGVPTFVIDGRAAFVRLMSRPGGDAALARRTIEGVVSLFDDQPDLNEYKFTKLDR